MSKSITPLGKACLVTAFTLAAVGGIFFFYEEEPKTPEELTQEAKENKIAEEAQKRANEQKRIKDASSQYTGSIEMKFDGKEYKIWDGAVIENYDNNRVNYTNEFDHIIYDFDLKTIHHMSEKGETKTLFSDYTKNGVPLPEHIGRVRIHGCQIAKEYFKRERSIDYTAAPKDVTAFYQRHCKIVIQ